MAVRRNNTGRYLQLSCLCFLAPFILGIYLDSRLKSDHVYYIAAVEIEWDYAPSGKDQVNVNNSNAEFYISRGAGRIGSKYRKAVYREYTDSTFSQQKPHPEWLGVVGPIIKLEALDTVRVHFKNLASRPYSINVHGGIIKDESKYKPNGKQYEGALYDDGTANLLKKDDAVPPGGEWLYIWRASYDEAPEVLEDRCVPWIYQSHVDAVRDAESGLIGVVLVCRDDSPISERTYERQKKITKDFILLWKIFDENLSWYIDVNINKYAGTSLINKADETFRQSNRMHSANGYVFGNLPGLEMCKNEYIGWFMVGYGSSFDVHSVTFHGHTLIYDDKRTNMIGMFPMDSASSRMLALHPGNWLIRCAVHEHYEAGMQAFFTVNQCNNTDALDLYYGSTSRKTKEEFEWKYFIAVEEVIWDYAPSGIDQMTGQNLTKPGSLSAEYFIRTNGRLGGRYKKARYVEYTDASFSVKKSRDASEEHMGLLGPVIKASVGSKIKVVFKNMASRPYSIHPTGVVYDKANEGMLYNDGTTGEDKEDDAVPPGGMHVYRWWIPAVHFKRSNSDDCVTHIYHSGVDPVRDVHTGLVGPIIICSGRHINTTTGEQKNRARELYLHTSVIDESKSWYFEENVISFGHGNIVARTSHSLKRHNINGFMYANMPVVEMTCKQERNSVHLLTTGGQRDFFTLYFHGEFLKEAYSGRPFAAMQPGQARTLRLVPYNEGEWAITAGKFSFTNAGMSAKYRISNCSQANENNTVPNYSRISRGKVYQRTFYIAAVEIEWDYAPHDHNIITGDKLSIPGRPSYIYVSRTDNTLGSKYKKAVYREFEDESFTKMKKRSPNEEYLGILGPVIKGGGGDTINVVFKNLASRPYSIHPVGIITNKTDDGYGYNDGSIGDAKQDDAVAPGDIHRYKWYLPLNVAPSFADPYCYSLVYHSAVDPMRDVNSGLVGPLHICKDNLLDENLTRSWPTLTGYKEISLLFAVFDENLSWYLNENIKTYMTNIRAKYLNQSDHTFIASNKMHAINGYIYGNLPSLSHVMTSWSDIYFMSVGTQTEIHAPHLNSAGYTSKAKGSSRMHDAVPLFPGASISVEMHHMQFLLPGRWLIRCAVNEHFEAGMMALWDIKNPFQDLLDILNKPKKPDIHVSSNWNRLQMGWRVIIILAIIAVAAFIITTIICFYRKRHRQSSSQEADAAATPLNTVQFAKA